MEATIGSISHGTLRTEDIISAFIDELRVRLQHEKLLDGDNEHTKLLAEAEKCLEDEETEHDYVGDLLGELEDALTEYAPPYCYFGASMGDGSDFGYWPNLDAIDELPQVEGSEEAKALGEDCKFVNDHGNVTVYGGDGKVIIDFV